MGLIYLDIFKKHETPHVPKVYLILALESSMATCNFDRAVRRASACGFTSAKTAFFTAALLPWRGISWCLIHTRIHPQDNPMACVNASSFTRMPTCKIIDIIVILILGNPEFDNMLLDGLVISNHIIWKPVEGCKLRKAIELYW